MSMSERVQIVVTFLDNTIGYFPASPLAGWKVRASDRVLVVGKGLTRTEIPLDNVRYYQPEAIPTPRPEPQPEPMPSEQEDK